MIRRMQLLEPEQRSSTSLYLAALVERLRDGLPRDNRVIPAVLAGLALLIFAWLVAGVFLGDPDVQEEQQASNQASLAQEDSDSGGPETPAPGVENRDTDSYAEFGDPEDPFYPSSDVEDLFPRDGGGGDRGGNGGGGDRGGNDGNGGNGGNGDRNGNGGNGDRGGGNGGNGDRGGDRDGDAEDFIEQDPPEDPGDPGGDPGSAPGDAPGGVPGGGPGQGGGGDLFNSGGDLPIP